MDDKELRQCWRTPPELWARIKEQWSPTVDLAANRANHLCPAWCGPDSPDPDMRDAFTSPLNGLYDCGKVIYCNPGFANLGPWCELCHDLVRRRAGNPFNVAVMMVLVAPSTAWWNEWALKADEIIYLTPRVNFIAPPGIKQTSNNRDNALLVYRRVPDGMTGGARHMTWRWK